MPLSVDDDDDDHGEGLLQSIGDEDMIYLF